MRILFLLFSCFMMLIVQAQTTIIGSVTDSLHHPLEGATVSLFKDSSTAAFRIVRSARNGFQLRRIPAGSYRLTIQFTGFTNYKGNVQVRSADTLLVLPVIRMQSAVDTSLVSVVVKTTIPPVLARQDTIVYNASAFKVRPNASVQELLRKLPGVQVDRDGNVNVQGQKVEKIFLDGKEFLLNDPKLLTQEFSADMIAAVEAFDNRSDEARFTGLSGPGNGNGKALNLRLKKEMRKGVFGKMYGAYGTDQGYAAGLNVNRFTTDQWISAQANINNINDRFNGSSDPVRGTGSQGDRRAGSALINYRDQLGRDAQVNSNYRYNDNRISVLNQSVRRSFYSDSTLVQNRKGQTDNRNSSHGFNAQTELRIGSMNVLVFQPSFQYRESRVVSSDVLSLYSEKTGHASTLLQNAITNSDETSIGRNFSGSLRWQHRFFKRGRNMVLTFSGDAGNENAFRSLLTSTNTQNLNQQTTRRNPTNTKGVQILYTEPLGKNRVLDLNYSLRSSFRESERITYNYNGSTGKYDLIDSLTTNHFENRLLSQRAAVGYNASAGKLRYQLGLAALITQQKNEVIFGMGNDISQSLVNWSPRAALYHQRRAGELLTIQYNGQSTQPTIEQLQPLPDLSNPLLVRVGNTSLRPQFDHTLMFNYNKFRSKGGKSLMASLQGGLTTLKITPATRLVGSVQEIRYVNATGVYRFSGNVHYGISPGQNGRVDGGVNARYTRDAGFVNDVSSISRSFGVSPTVMISYEIGGLSIDASGSPDYSHTHYSIGERTVKLLRQNYSLSARYELPGGLLVNSDIYLDLSGKQAGLPANNVTIWNAYLSKNVFGNKSGELRLTAFDLLNQSRGFFQTVGEQFIEQRTTNVQQRLLLLSFVWNVRKFGI